MYIPLNLYCNYIWIEILFQALLIEKFTATTLQGLHGQRARIGAHNTHWKYDWKGGADTRRLPVRPLLCHLSNPVCLRRSHRGCLQIEAWGKNKLLYRKSWNIRFKQFFQHVVRFAYKGVIYGLIKISGKSCITTTVMGPMELSLYNAYQAIRQRYVRETPGLIDSSGFTFVDEHMRGLSHTVNERIKNILVNMFMKRFFIRISAPNYTGSIRRPGPRNLWNTPCQCNRISHPCLEATARNAGRGARHWPSCSWPLCPRFCQCLRQVRTDNR